MIKEAPQERYLELAQIAVANGFVKRLTSNTFAIINIGYNPYVSNQAFYDHLTKVSSVWQRLVFAACKDRAFIQFILSELKDIDPWVDFLSQIYDQYKPKPISNKINVERYDFICDQTNTPKIVQYNLTVVGITSFSKIIQKSLKQFHLEDAQYYLPCNASDTLVQSISNHIQKRSLRGSVLMVVSLEINTLSEIQDYIRLFNEHKITVKKAKFSEVFKKLSVDQHGDLYYNGQMFSFVYFRHGFVIQQFQQFYPNIQDVIDGKVMLANSNAVCIPDITSQIINLKRAQCELSKPQTMRKYLSENDAKILQTSITETLELSKMTEENFQALVQRIKGNSQKWVLKPNREAGGNNFFGDDVIKVLETLPQEMRKGYILQQKIMTNYDENYSINSDLILTKTRCDYELGKFAITSQIDGVVDFENNCGGSVRMRGENSPQCGVFIKGSFNCYCGWKIQE